MNNQSGNSRNCIRSGLIALVFTGTLALASLGVKGLLNDSSNYQNANPTGNNSEVLSRSMEETAPYGIPLAIVASVFHARKMRQGYFSREDNQE